MPTIKVVNKEKTIEVSKGANLRKALLDNDINPYKGIFKVANCGGHGKCGKCAVEIVDKDNKRIQVERSCQIVVEDDMSINISPEK